MRISHRVAIFSSAFSLLSATPVFAADAAATIRETIRNAFLAFEKRDTKAAQSIYVPGDRLVVYDMFPPAATDSTGYNQLDTAKPVPSDTKNNEGREVGFLTSVASLPEAPAPVCLGYVRRECNTIGVELTSGPTEGGTRLVVATKAFEPLVPA